jgi:hypothetical protein
MAILNITYRGRSADVPDALDDRLDDLDVRRIAVELIRSGELGISDRNLAGDAFRHFVVDRYTGPDGVLRIYLRPKVPFGTAPEPASPGLRSAGSEATGATREGGAERAQGPARAQRAPRTQ